MYIIQSPFEELNNPLGYCATILSQDIKIPALRDIQRSGLVVNNLHVLHFRKVLVVPHSRSLPPANEPHTKSIHLHREAALSPKQLPLFAPFHPKIPIVQSKILSRNLGKSFVSVYGSLPRPNCRNNTKLILRNTTLTRLPISGRVPLLWELYLVLRIIERLQHCLMSTSSANILRKPVLEGQLSKAPPAEEREEFAHDRTNASFVVHPRVHSRAW